MSYYWYSDCIVVPEKVCIHENKSSFRKSVQGALKDKLEEKVPLGL